MKIEFEWDKTYKKAVIKCSNNDILQLIRENLSYEDSTAGIRKKKSPNNKYIADRKYLITNTNRFGIGLFPTVYREINKLQVPLDIEVTEEFKKKFKPSYPFKDEELYESITDPRYYQTDVVRKFLSQGCGICVLGTAGGKTLIMFLLVMTVLKYHPDSVIVVIVPDLHLVEQTYEGFIKEGIDEAIIGRWTAEHELDVSKKIVIAGAPILMSKKTNLNYLYSSDLLLIDEVHKLRKKNKINKLIKKVLTPHKFGVTGTMPEELEDQWNIVGNIGPIVYDKPSFELREEGFISNVKINIIKLFYEDRDWMYELLPTLDNPKELYKKECEFIWTNEFRNQVLCHLVKGVKHNILVLVDRIDHGEYLLKYLQERCKNKKVYFVKGEVEVRDRQQITQTMEQNDDVICIAISKIFSTGIDIKNLHHIVFASGGKAKVKIVQAIGRGLRLHESKIRLTIFDLVDMLIYGSKHLKKRINLYKAERIKYEIKKIHEQ